MEKFLTTKELSRYLKLNPITILRKARKGEIPSIRIGRQFRYDEEQIENWLKNRGKTGKIKILVIDDEPLIGMLMNDIFKNEPYILKTCYSGEEGLASMESVKYDVIFLDLMMPVMNGAKTFELIRQRDKKVPVVIITGYPDSELMQQAMQFGPFTVIKKPFDVSEVKELVHNIVASRT